MRAILLIPVSLVLACKHEPPPPAELVAADVLCSDPKYDSHMDSKTALEVTVRVTVEGYLDIPRGMVTLCSRQSCPAALLPAPGAVAKKLSISLTNGDDPAQMKTLPDHYTESDLVVHTTDGRVVGVGAKVRVTGKRLGDVKSGSCQLIDVDRVDAL
jgi:hypothetical protein